MTYVEDNKEQQAAIKHIVCGTSRPTQPQESRTYSDYASHAGWKEPPELRINSDYEFHGGWKKEEVKGKHPN